MLHLRRELALARKMLAKHERLASVEEHDGNTTLNSAQEEGAVEFPPVWEVPGAAGGSTDREGAEVGACVVGKVSSVTLFCYDRLQS